MKKIQLQKDIYVIEDFWSPQTCQDFIAKSEGMGYEAATIQTELGPRMVDSVRNNERVIYKDFQLAEELWSLLQSFSPGEIGNSLPIGLNELFRFYKYEPGQQFRKHRDQSYIRNSREASYFTFMIYLNDDFKGGTTTFDDITVHPKRGMALVFYHYLEHAGSAVMEGVKYVLRTDIMFRLK